MSETGTTELPEHLARPSKVVIRDSESSTDTLIDEISSQLEISQITARVLTRRGIASVEEARSFLYPTLREHLPDPRKIKNILDATKLIIEALESNKQITVYSDFDVDGLSAGSQLDLFLSSVGGLVNHYTPNRFTEGYGLVESAIEKLRKAETELLITVDCGVTNSKEIALAKKYGMQVLVLDHHQVRDLPPADVVVDPAQEGCPFKDFELCAAGLVWMLIIVLRGELKKAWAERLEEEDLEIPDPKDFLDLAALGTICDMVPLRRLNRVIAYRGVEALRATKRPGLVALKEAANISNSKRLTSGHVSFALGPRINAAGRLEDPNQVFELLTTANTLRAKKIANKVNRLNTRRRAVEDSVRKDCLDFILDNDLTESPAFAIFGEEFHSGVIGIVAQRVVEHYYRPSAVMAPGEMKNNKGETIEVIKGSVRSIEGFNVAEVLQELDSCLLKHGGHSSAGGFTLLPENLAEFQDGFIEAARTRLSPEQFVRTLKADAEVSLSEIDFDVVNELSQLQPFGMKNPSPVLVAHDVLIESVQSLSEGHVRLRLSADDCRVGAVAWRFRGHPLLTRGRKVSIAFQPEINTYQGLSSVQLTIKEIW